MSKIVEKFTKKMTALILSVAMLLPTFAPLSIYATEYGSGDYKLSSDVNTSEAEHSSLTSLTINGDSWASSSDLFQTDNGVYNVVLTLTSDDENYVPNFRRGGFEGVNVTTSNEGNNYTYSFTYTATDNHNPFLSFTLYDEGEDDSEPGMGEEYEFDGTIYFVWVANNQFYKYKITDIPVGVEDPETGLSFETKYVKLSDVKDGSVQYHLGEDYYFVWTEAYESIQDEDDFIALSATEKLSFLREEEMTVDPTGAVSGENSISTNGARKFRLTIYNDAENTYEGLQIGVPSDYTYFPDFWDGALHNDVVDVSETTKENPVQYDAFLLEKTIEINSDAFSNEITSVEALDVPSKAVTITKKAAGVYDIKYNSNYYNNVEFKITDEEGKTYYVVFTRNIVRLFQKVGGSTFLKLYYDKNESYNDYDVVINTNYKDGTTKTTVATAPSSGLEDEFGNPIAGLEMNAGDNLKAAIYDLPDKTSSDVTSYDITVVKKGALSSTTYSGTYAGNGYGIKVVKQSTGQFKIEY